LSRYRVLKIKISRDIFRYFLIFSAITRSKDLSFLPQREVNYIKIWYKFHAKRIIPSRDIGVLKIQNVTGQKKRHGTFSRIFQFFSLLLIGQT